MKTIAITLKYNYRSDNTEKARQYKEWIKFARSRGVTPYDLRKEYDKLQRLHIHGKAMYPDDWDIEKFKIMTAMKGFHVWPVEMDNEPGWDKYITKDIAITAAIEEAKPVPWIGSPDQIRKEVDAAIKLVKPIPISLLDLGWGV